MASHLGPEKLRDIEEMMREVAELEYPKVWVGEEAMKADRQRRSRLWYEQHTRQKYWKRTPNKEDREALHEAVCDSAHHLRGVEQSALLRSDRIPGEQGIAIPAIGDCWLDGSWVVENLPDELPRHLLVELDLEVMHIRAAKRGLVVVVRNSAARVKANLAPLIELLPPDRLTNEDDPDKILTALDYYAGEFAPCYVIDDTLRARRALALTLGKTQSKYLQLEVEPLWPSIGSGHSPSARLASRRNGAASESS